MRTVGIAHSLLLGTILMAGCTERNALPTQGSINASITSPREPDNNRHANVGALFRDLNGDGQMQWELLEGPCSGLLIAPTVFLTAGHCLAGVDPKTPVRVSFEEQVLPWPTTSILATGFAVDPEFNPGSQFHDLAVVFLPVGATTVPPVPLPAAGRLDRLAEQGVLQGQAFLKVGYGMVPTWEGAPLSLSPPGSRTASLEPFIALPHDWLFLLMNYNATGQGGICFFDSGSPHFLEAVLGDTALAVTSMVDSECRAWNANWRLDTPEARGFLAKYVTLPQ